MQVAAVSLLLFFAALPTIAQTATAVSGTITDTNGIPYSFAKVSASLVGIPPSQTATILVNGNPTQIGGQFNGAADQNGAFSMNLFCNSAGGGCSVISPSGTQWQITVTTNGVALPLGTGPQTCVALVTITGASQSLTINFSACPALSKVTSGSSTGLSSRTVSGTTAADSLSASDCGHRIVDAQTVSLTQTISSSTLLAVNTVCSLKIVDVTSSAVALSFTGFQISVDGAALTSSVNLAQNQQLFITLDASGTSWDGDLTPLGAASGGGSGIPFGTDNGAVNVMTVTTSPAIATNAAGTIVAVLPGFANTTTTPTLNVGGAGAQTIVKGPAQAALLASDYNTTTIALFESDGTHWQLLNPLNPLNTAYTAAGNGSTGTPAYNFTNATNCGMYYNGGNQLGMACNGSQMGIWGVINGNNGLATNVLQLATASSDTVVQRLGLGNPGWGVNSATPQAYTHNMGPSSRSGTDSNVAGASVTVQPGNGTGTSVPSQYNIFAPQPGTGSGTGAQTQAIRAGFGWTKSLSNNTATTVANVTNASNTVAMVIVHYGVEIFDGTNLQWETGLAMCGVVNKAGVFSNNTCTKSGNAQGLGSGTLTVTWTITGANPALLQITSNSSLTTTVNRVNYNIEQLGSQAVAIQ